MRTRTRRLIVIAIVLIVIAAIGVAVYLRRRGGPEPARLLPEGNAIIYIKFKTLRLLTGFGEKPAANRDPDYEQFVRETGFEFERDLDEAAFVQHAPSIANRAAGARYSEIFIGRFDSQKLGSYLRNHARSTERYRDTDIFSIPMEDRTFRVAIVGLDTVAASNSDDAGMIHGMIDRYKHVALPFAGPELLRDYYKHVPFASPVWAITKFQGDVHTELPGGFNVFVPTPSVLVASARYTGTVHAKAELFAQNEADAAKFADEAGTFLAIFRSLEGNMQTSGNDPDVKAIFDSLKVDRDKNRATISTSVPIAFFKKMFSEAPAELTIQPQQEEKKPEEQKAPATKQKNGKKSR